MAMASTTINNPTLEDLVKCAICLDYYNDPRLLPCSHTFCYKCIQDLSKDGYIQCPMRDNMIVHRQMISRLPVNRVAKDFVECIIKSTQTKSSKSQTNCDHCQQILSEFVCKTCSKSYCKMCLKLNHHIDHLKSHIIHININQTANNFCLEHTEERLKYWCHLCQQTVCSDCLLFKHKQHSFITLQDIKQKIKSQLQLSIQEFITIREDLQKLNDKTTQTSHTHYQTHIKTINHIEQTINDLQALLEERKKYLIKTINQNDAQQQNIIQEHKNNIQEHLKTVLIQELFTSQLLNCEDSFQLVQMKDDLMNSNQLIQEEYQQLMEGFIFDLQHFTVENTLSKIQLQLEHLGDISTDTYLTNSNDIHPLLKLSQLSGQDKYQELQGNYAYGYRFHLDKTFKLNTLRVKLVLFSSDLTILILNHNDIIIQKQIFKQTSTILKWLTIPLTCEIQHNYYIFVWTQSNETSIPLIAYKDSNQNLRQINEHVSIRSKRAQINKSTNIDIGTKLNVIYDALFNNDQTNQTTTPAIEMILDTF